MSQRTAPKCGYDVGAKRAYRRRVWSTFDRWVGADKSNTRCLLMPSSEGDEVDVALSHGFRERNLHIVDANTAIVATLKRMRFHNINAHGGDVVEVVLRLMNKGVRLDVLNLDFCGHSVSVGENMMRAFNLYSGMNKWPLIAVTVQRGRESRWAETRAELKRFDGHFWDKDYPPDDDVDRLRAVGAGLWTWSPTSGSPLLVQSFTYRTNAVQMLVSFWTIAWSRSPTLVDRVELWLRLKRMKNLSPWASELERVMTDRMPKGTEAQQLWAAGEVDRAEGRAATEASEAKGWVLSSVESWIHRATRP